MHLGFGLESLQERWLGVLTAFHEGALKIEEGFARFLNKFWVCLSGFYDYEGSWKAAATQGSTFRIKDFLFAFFVLYGFLQRL